MHKVVYFESLESTNHSYKNQERIQLLLLDYSFKIISYKNVLFQK